MIGGVRLAQPFFERIRRQTVSRSRPARSAARRRARCRRRPPTTPSTSSARQPAIASIAAASASARRADLVRASSSASAAPARSPARGRRRTRRASLRARRRSACRRAARASADGVRIRSTSAARPTMMPACGPPSSLSPLKQQTSTPAATLSSTVGSSRRVDSGQTCVRARSIVPAEVAAAEILGDRDVEAVCRARPAPSSAGRSVKPSMREVRRVDAEDQRGPLADRRARSRRRGCGWSSRPRAAARPTAPSRRARGSRRRSRPARRARRSLRVPPPAPPAPAASPRRCC